MWPGSSHGKGHRVEDILDMPGSRCTQNDLQGAAGGADLRSVTMPRSRADWGGVMEQPSIRTATKQNGHKVTTKRYQNHIHLANDKSFGHQVVIITDEIGSHTN